MKPLFLFAPGAGAPSTHLWMQQWKERLQTIGDAEIFDYAYTREHRKRPDPLPQLIASHRLALAEAREKHPNTVTILIGKSMGGRMGCHVSLTEKVDGLVCLGYPLCAMGDRTKLRDEVLRALMTPILFLHVVEGGDHSLRVPKRKLQTNGETQEDVDQQVLKAITGFVDQLPLAAD